MLQIHGTAQPSRRASVARNDRFLSRPADNAQRNRTHQSLIFFSLFIHPYVHFSNKYSHLQQHHYAIYPHKQQHTHTHTHTHTHIHTLTIRPCRRHLRCFEHYTQSNTHTHASLSHTYIAVRLTSASKPYISQTTNRYQTISKTKESSPQECGARVWCSVSQHWFGWRCVYVWRCVYIDNRVKTCTRCPLRNFGGRSVDRASD